MSAIVRNCFLVASDTGTLLVLSSGELMQTRYARGVQGGALLSLRWARALGAAGLGLGAAGCAVDDRSPNVDIGGLNDPAVCSTYADCSTAAPYCGPEGRCQACLVGSNEGCAAARPICVASDEAPVRCVECNGAECQYGPGDPDVVGPGLAERQRSGAGLVAGSVRASSARYSAVLSTAGAAAPPSVSSSARYQLVRGAPR